MNSHKIALVTQVAAERYQGFGKFGDRKVFISEVFDELLTKWGFTPNLAEYKKILIEANRQHLT